MINKPYEVIIIGSGATGGMAALTMAKAGVRALIIRLIKIKINQIF